MSSYKEYEWYRGKWVKAVSQAPQVNKQTGIYLYRVLISADPGNGRTGKDEIGETVFFDRALAEEEFKQADSTKHPYFVSRSEAKYPKCPTCGEDYTIVQTQNMYTCECINNDCPAQIKIKGGYKSKKDALIAGIMSNGNVL